MEIQLTPNPSIKHPRPEVEAPTENPEGWWNLANLRGTREGVLKAIDAAKDVPDRWKACLKADIEALPAEFNFIWLDAHCHAGAKHTYHITLEADSALV